MAWRCVVLLVGIFVLASVTFAYEGDSTLETKLPGRYQILDLYDNVENDSEGSTANPQSKCPPELQIGNLRHEDDGYKLDFKKDLQFSEGSCEINPGIDGDMLLRNIETGVPAEGNKPPDDIPSWKGSLHDSSANGVMSCERMGLVASVEVEVVKSGDVLEQVFQMIGLLDLFHGKSDSILQTFGDEAAISVMFNNNMCVFLTRDLAQFFNQIAEGKETRSSPFISEGIEDPENWVEHKESEPELATWLPGQYWSFDFTEKFDIKEASMSGPNCPQYLTVERVSTENGGFQIDLQNDVNLGEEKCTFNSEARHRTVTLKWTSTAEEYDDYSEIPKEEVPEGFQETPQDSNQSYGKSPPIQLVGYLPTVPVKDFMSCVKMGPLSSITLSITDQNPYSQYLKELESGKDSDSTSEVADMNFIISVGFGNTGCMYLKQEDIERLKKVAGEDSYDPDDEYGHYPGEKVENLSFSQVCPCHSSFPKEYDSKGKTEFLIEEFRKSMHEYGGSSSQHEGSNNMMFELSDFCAKNASFSVPDLLSALNGTTSSATSNLLRGAVDQIYDELFDDPPPPVRIIMLRNIWNEVRYQTKFRRIIMQKKDSDCETSPVLKDSVLLIEFQHTLYQMDERAIMKDLNKTKIYEMLYAERRSQGLTMHMLQASNDESLLKCTYTSSKLAKTILSPQCTAHGNFDRVLGKSGVGHIENTNQTPEDEMVSASPIATPDSSTFGSMFPSPTPSLTESNFPVVSSSVTPSRTPSPSVSDSNASSISPSPSPTQGSSGVACFPGSAKVELEDGSLLAMDKLKVGQRVRDATGKFSSVLLFAHSNRDVLAKFVHVQSAKGDIALSLRHYIYVNNNLVVAEHVRVGDQIRVLDLNCTEQVSWTRVLKVSSVLRRGLFNPQTTSGSIAVYWKGNAVMASTYTAAVAPKLAHRLLGPLSWLESKLGLTIPMLSSFLIDGSSAWAWLLPSGSALYEL